MLPLPGAVPAAPPDEAVAAHYGSLHTEQRALAHGEGFVDLSHRDVVRISGPDRLTWLHNLTTQYLESLAPHTWTTALILSPNGHVEHAFTGVDDGAETFTAHTEPSAGQALVDFLESMKFMTRVEVALVTDEVATVWRPVVEEAAVGGEASVVEEAAAGGRLETTTGTYEFVPREKLASYADQHGPAAGLWAFEALRIARGEPRLGMDTDERTIPNEVGWTGTAVHMDKGCYRGQETVARVYNLGRPPRRLVLLHLDGSMEALPDRGAELRHGERVVGFVGSSARHYELGPIALGIVKRNVPVEATLTADGIAATQEVIVDPEVGLHFRAAHG